MTGLSPGRPPRSHAANSYDFVRFCAASAVIFSHHYFLSGRDEPVVPLYGEDFGELGVEIFFCLSGFLICQSLYRSRDWVRFAAARLLRIFPNLAVALIFTSVATLLWFGNGIHWRDHIGYVTGNVAMALTGLTDLIPGVFERSFSAEVNDPLWTLPYEMWLYVVLALLFAIGRRYAGLAVIAALIVFGAAWLVAHAGNDFDVGPLESYDAFRLASYFLSGATLAVIWPTLERHAVAVGFAGLILAVAVQQFAPPDTPLHALTLAAAVIGLGSSRAMAWYGRGGDPSYGMYIFAWPIQQFSLLLIGSFWLSLLVAFAAATAIGYATWHGFERRIMTYPSRIAARITRSA